MLTDTKIKSLKPKEKPYKVADRDGLYLQVSTSGVKSFKFNYRFAGRQETITFGQYPVITLTMARDMLIEAKRYLAEGESPARKKKDGLLKKKSETTISDSVTEWLDKAQMAESTRNARRYIVKRIISPKLGSLKVSELTDLDIRRAIEPLIDKAPSTALMVRDILSSLYRWLNEAKGLRIDNPAQYIKPSAIHVFHSRDRNLSASEIRDFYAALSFTPIASSNKAFLKLLLLTAVRKGELIGARWSEIDFEEEKWAIPPERMKGSLAHIVYLSHQAIDLLMGLQLVGGGSSEYVFPGRNDTTKSIVSQSPNKWINDARRASEKKGIKIEPFSPHDFRRTFSTFANEHGFRGEIIEKCLAHESHDIRAVYNRAEYATERRELMQWWADEIDSITSQGQEGKENGR